MRGWYKSQLRQRGVHNNPGKRNCDQWHDQLENDRPCFNPTQLKPHIFEKRSWFEIVLIQNRNDNEPDVEFAQEPPEAQSRIQKHSRSKFAMERQHDHLEIQLCCPVKRRAELAIERSAHNQEQRNGEK